MKRLLTLGFAIVMSLSFWQSVEGASKKPKRGGTLTMTIQKDLTRMNPMVGTFSTERLIRELMFDSLFARDIKGNQHPNLVEKWVISNGGKLYTFKLREGVKFHNGKELAAEDVKFSMEYAMNPKNGAYGLTKLKAVDRVEAADKYTLKVHLKRANASFLSYLSDIAAFAVVPKESMAEGIARTTAFPPGTGPFKFVKWEPRRRLIFERHGDHWGQKAFVDRLILRPIRNDTVRFTALRAGDVDIVERTPYEWAKQVIEGKFKDIGYTTASTAGYVTIKFNVTAGPFSDKNLRLAVAHAVNKKQILHAAYFGFGEPSDQKYPKGTAWNLEGIPAPHYDLAKAKSYLKSSNYKGASLGILIYTTATWESVATTLQAQLKKIGMNIKVDAREHGSFTTQAQTGDFEFAIWGGGLQPDPSATYYQDFKCPALKKRRLSVSGYCDKEVDALLKKAEGELDSQKRRELFKQILTKTSDSMPQLPIGYVPRFFTFKKSVKGFATDSAGAFRYWGGGLNYTWLDR